MKSKKVLQEVHIDLDLALDKSETFQALLIKYIDVFSKDDLDIGDCYNKT